MRIFFLIVFGYGTVNLYAQNSGAWSLLFPLPELTVFVHFPEPVEKIEQVLEEERDSHSALKSWIYAVGIDVSIDPQTSGQWDTIPGKGYVWRIGIYADDAHSLNLFIENYRMQPGMALYAYGESQGNMAGPFDARNNTNGGILPVQSLPGDRLVVEWNIPIQAASRNDFIITNIGYGFRDMGKMISLASAARCNIDINCRTGNHWQREKRSVVRLETKLLNGRTQYCTGTLVNQAVKAGEQKPYILTAHHCISNEELAQRTTFVFDYEKALCGTDSLFAISAVSGANLRATKWELDFALLELPESGFADVPRPYYAGWNRTGIAAQGVVGIHHPQGDVKKMAATSRLLVTETFEDKGTNLFCDKNAHWKVSRWDDGVTEPGSSGSVIFDVEHKIVGTLSGGIATCSNPVNDYYSKFSEQWNRYPADSASLKPWLDPDNKGVTSLWGYDPVSLYEGRCDTLGHIGRNESKTLVESGEWGYLTSQYDRTWISFAEKFENDTTAIIMGMEVNVARVSESGAKVRFSVWRGNDFPVTLLYAKDTIVSADYVNYPMHIYFDRTLEITGNYFIGYSLEYDDPQELFAVYQSAKRPYTGISAMYVEDGNGLWMALEEYLPPVYSSLDVRALGRFNRLVQKYKPAYKNLNIIFQAEKNTIIIDFEDLAVSSTVRIECYDTSGKRMAFNELSRHLVMYGENTYLQVELNVNNLPSGVYLIQVFDKNKKQAGKFVKLF